MSRDIAIDRLLGRGRAQRGEPAYYNKVNGTWQPTTWQQYIEKVQFFARGLVELGFSEGDSLSILSFNRPEWLIACLGAQMAGGISAGIYTTNAPEEVEYIVNHADSTFFIVENKQRWDEQVLPVLSSFSKIKKFVFLENADEVIDDRVISFEDVGALGSRQNPKRLDERTKKIDPDKVSTLIYTSGTTGPPKAVMLSHRSLAWTVRTAVDLMNIGNGDVMLSYLPLAHIAEQMFSVYCPLASGITLYFAESVEKMPENMKEVQPTVFFGVPRVYEKMYEKVKEKTDAASGVKGAMLSWARKVAFEYWKEKNSGRTSARLLQFQYQLARSLVFDKMKPLLGMGRARVCVTGAAPISNDILEFFQSLDIPLYEVYGQSEDSGPTSLNIPGAAKLGSVGRPIPGVKVKIADDGEILVSGPNVFLGYYKDQEATDEVLKNGWLYSGDVGVIDRQGYLKITDRKKDLLITAGGKNIAPQNLEGMLKQIPFVSLAVVIGDGRKFLSALLTPNADYLGQFASKLGISNSDLSALVTNSSILQKIQEDIDLLNKKLAPVEQIKKFAFLPVDFGIASGELTPTMKIKRKAINARYHDTIEAFYA